MSSLADLPELIGFFSYSREDDEDSNGALSALRERIQRELRGQLGRSMKTFRLWQDKEAIASGTLWEVEIKTAAEQSVFFIPIITPTVVKSPYCRFELDSFLAREAALGRSDLVFPILYIKVSALDDSIQRENDPVLSIIAKRQYLDWREFRHRDVTSTDVKEAVERFCAHICEALHRPWLSPEERQQTAEAEARRRAEEEQRQREEKNRLKIAAEAERQRLEREAGAKRDAEERARRVAAAEAERQRQERDAAAAREAEEKARQVEQRLRDQAEAKRRAEEEAGRRLQAPEPRPAQPPSRRAKVIGSVVGLAVLGAIGVWFVEAPSGLSALSQQQERALKPKDTFKECSNCPEMIVVPTGSFTMGSPANEPQRAADESPQHTVTFARQLAVGKFALTLDEWNACIADGGCNATSLTIGAGAADASR
jgi:hypothetical protein